VWDNINIFIILNIVSVFFVFYHDIIILVIEMVDPSDSNNFIYEIMFKKTYRWHIFESRW